MENLTDRSNYLEWAMKYILEITYPGSFETVNKDEDFL
jgi:hypothetical protein